MVDKRDAEVIGKKLQELKEQYPNMTAAERADMIERDYVYVNGDGK